MIINEKRIGRYEVVSVLGRGAMGTVYKAIDPVIERTVAIKTINLDLSSKERAEFEQRFYREAKSAGRLSHPNIVTIYDVGETDDVAYIAMEYLEGESLREFLDTGVVLPMSHICKIARRIAGALYYAHENQVIHRDIKPANIMIARDRDIKIMDFGIAKVPTGSRTLDGTVLGSPKYMAPEQIIGQPTDARTDIFALGAILYEMLTGRAPFSGENLNAIMYSILHEDPPPPSEVTARVPAEFDRIVAKALAKRPEDRYQTAREFASDLHACERSAPSEVRTVSRKREKPRPETRAPVPAGDATVLLAPNEPVNGAAVDPRTPVTDVPVAALRLLGRTGRRNALLFAISALSLVAIALFMQRHPPYEAATRPTVAQDKAGGRGGAPAPAVPGDEAAPLAAESAIVEASVAASIDPAQGAAASAATPPAATKVPSAAQAGPSNGRTKPARATVQLAVAPWGRVFIDGKSAGVSPPLKRLQLAPGVYTVEIRNKTSTPYRQTLTVASGDSLMIRHKFN
ncbi:MAG: protein kinase [Betaproteobacteria bacterium]